MCSMRRCSTASVLSSRGLNALQYTGTATASRLVKSKDVISLAVAENKLMLDVQGPKLQSAAREETEGTSYAPSWLGTPMLRQSFANLYNNHVLKQRKIAAEQVAVVASATSAIDLLLHVLCESGDAVLTPAPCYGSYRRDVEALASCRLVPVVGAGGCLPTLKDLEAAQEADNGRILLLSNPQNPTGHISDPTELLALVEWATKQHSMHVIVDEVFALSTFDGEDFVSALDLTFSEESRVHVVYSASKDCALSGYRVGCVFTRAPDVVRAFGVIGAFASPSMLAQLATEDFLDDDAWLRDVWIPQLRSRLTKSYANAKENLARYGISVKYDPRAGHFCTLDLSAFFDTPPASLRNKTPYEADAIFSEKLLDAGVILTPGAPSMGTDTPGIFRLCHAGHDTKTVAEGIRRIHLALTRLAVGDDK